MISFQETCRICAHSASPTIKLVTVFGDEGVKKDLQFKLYNCLKVLVTKEDILPTSICEFCISRLDIYYNLVQDCWKGQTYFANLHLYNKSQCFNLMTMSTSTQIIDSKPAKPAKSETQQQTQINQIIPDVTDCKEEEEEDTDDEDNLLIVEDTSSSFDSNSCDRLEAEAPSQTQYAPSTSQPRPKNPKKSGTTFVCSYCDKKYYHRGDFNKHLRKHTGEQPYQCDICFKKFAHTSNLTRHKLVHSGDRPFECEKCHRRFNRKDKLAIHKRCKTI